MPTDLNGAVKDWVKQLEESLKETRKNFSVTGKAIGRLRVDVETFFNRDFRRLGVSFGHSHNHPSPSLRQTTSGLSRMLMSLDQPWQHEIAIHTGRDDNQHERDDVQAEVRQVISKVRARTTTLGTRKKTKVDKEVSLGELHGVRDYWDESSPEEPQPLALLSNVVKTAILNHWQIFLPRDPLKKNSGQSQGELLQSHSHCTRTP
ncbi:hypothetical protein K431DRAFT_290319 [Polychaeton citri CBS 116435]|uniref:Uncharacterized protein n=1 Tax=Polychaeton citri CBS 116435 TaxID=1314669 RepID=A0A9P4QHE2_9PEZI|nr:hypothetical protein K431DRAFT_290319 [Polychaeton citri CBS 116435]